MYTSCMNINLIIIVKLLFFLLNILAAELFGKSLRRQTALVQLAKVCLTYLYTLLILSKIENGMCHVGC